MPDPGYDYKWVDVGTGIERHPVQSSNISEVGYRRDPGKQTGILEIKFVKGDRVYQYYDVPWQRVRSFLAAPSLGEYFHRHIRNEYYYAEVTG
jgi:hypothetical protein